MLLCVFVGLGFLTDWPSSVASIFILCIPICVILTLTSANFISLLQHVQGCTLRRNSSLHCVSSSKPAIRLYKDRSTLTEMKIYSVVNCFFWLLVGQHQTRGLLRKFNTSMNKMDFLSRISLFGLWGFEKVILWRLMLNWGAPIGIPCYFTL